MVVLLDIKNEKVKVVKEVIENGGGGECLF